MERDDEVELLESMFPEEMVLTDGDLYSFRLELKVAKEDEGEPETPLQLVWFINKFYASCYGEKVASPRLGVRSSPHTPLPARFAPLAPPPRAAPCLPRTGGACRPPARANARTRERSPARS